MFLKDRHQGSLLLITARGTRREIMEKIQAKILFSVKCSH